MAKRKSSSTRKTTGAKKAKVRSTRKTGASGARSVTTTKAKRKAKATAKTKVKAKARVKTGTKGRGRASGTSSTKAKATRSGSGRVRADGPAARNKPAASSAAASKHRKPSTGRPKSPRKRAGLSDEDLAIFRGLLLEKRAELAGDVHNMQREALRRNDRNGESDSSAVRTHMADVGSDNWEQEFTLGLLDKDVALLREIDQALERIESGVYGRCLATEKRITKPRLRAKPWAKYCIEYVRQLEQGQVP